MNSNSFRELTLSDGKVDFTSNDYLGLARSNDLAEIIQQKFTESGSLNGATGSRLLSGNNAHAEALEEKLGAIFRAEAALIFNSGYTANLGVLSTLPQRGDTIIYDELAHACIKDGARLSLAKRFSFAHNDINDLEVKLKKATGQIFIAVESIYSMDGDQCPLKDLVDVAKIYHAVIILDEAHSTGVIGINGSGLACHLGIEKDIAIRIYTFGKGMGVHGACVASSKKVINTLINFSRPFIYTTALPVHSISSIDASFDFLSKNITLQQNLEEKIKLFKSLLVPSKWSVIESNSAIQSILIKGNDRVKSAAKLLQEKRLDCRPILSPTVKEGSERIRVCLHAFNTEEEIRLLTNTLNQLSL